ncbi:biotin--[acetyl-CoA-carboxylase] ligase [Galactobacter caseinivorans]|uniref:biotin--[acetyl-CoA-carboxylase] ligase n=1 Tax=Galactobacter caseinivorans TaxID=2676123 RepID=UPI0013147427|nr:biotin--[acetyl-CoA-carboxylase] ligase [Galactobacter caseinivorans]
MTRELVLDAAAVTAARDLAWAASPAAGGSGTGAPAWPEALLPAWTGSTNEDLAALGPQAPHLSVVATLDQRSGRGRLDREWVAPAGAALATSLLLRPPAGVPVDALGWATVLVALVAAEAVDQLAGRQAAGVKWPNDLLVDGKKAAGILARLVPGQPPLGNTVVVGIGINLNQTRQELPVGTATSLAMAGIQAAGDQVLGTLWARLAGVSDEWFAANGSVTRPLAALGGRSVLEAARSTSATLGNEVRVHLPGGRELVGIATDLDSDGCLVVSDARGEAHHVHAGDVVHLRRSDGGYA